MVTLHVSHRDLLRNYLDMHHSKGNRGMFSNRYFSYIFRMTAVSPTQPLPKMSTPGEEKEPSAFADNFIRSLPGHELVMADENVKRCEKFANDARMAFIAQFETVPHPTIQGDLNFRRLVEKRGKEVHDIVYRAAMRHVLHELDQEIENLQEKAKEEDEISEVEKSTKLKEPGDKDNAMQ